MTAEELMAAYCDGDQGAFRVLYARAAPRLLGYLHRLAGNRATAEDLLQQTFLRLHHSRDLYVRGADPFPWLFTIAHRLFIDDVRRGRRTVGADALPEIPATLEGGRLDEAPDDGADPKLRAAALAALARLPENQRDALRLTKLEGKSTAEAAAILNISQSALKVRAHRAYRTLRGWLGEKSVDE